jgi:hypothetical protein
MRLRRLWLLALPLALGCGSGKTAPVSGRVLLDDKPLAKAKVNFQPIAREGDPNPGIGSYAETDADGYFTLKMVGNDAPGAVVGMHRVEISAYDRAVDPNDDRTRAPKNLVPPQYNRESKLRYEVPSGGTREANFELKSK